MFRQFSMTVNITIKRAVCIFFAITLLAFTGCKEEEQSSGSDLLYSKSFEMTDKSVVNPFMGFAVDATGKRAASAYSLVYIDITFRELQPDSPNSFNFEGIVEENNIELWKSQGKHAVLRFVCDKPTDEAHMDIPDWLYELTKDGTAYDTSYGKGYSPNYGNEVFIKYHKAAISAIAGYFSDGFISYVELGSLGHWGEWHVKREDGIVPMPSESVREEYVRHYTDAFKTEKLLMRRPFKGAYDKSLGLFNDMAGDPKSTEEWLDWINNGGDYTQTGESNALYAMPDFWKVAPCGGELTSSLTMEYLCGEGLNSTLELLKRSHTTFIGPKCPVSSSDKYDSELYQNAVKELIGAVGYRIGITQVDIANAADDGNYTVFLNWENAGVAPVYFDLPVKLYLRENGKLTELANVGIYLTELLPNGNIKTETKFFIDKTVDLSQKELVLAVIDPMNEKPCMELVSSQESESGQTLLYKFGHN